MCGGVIFPWQAEYKEFLEHFYSPEEIEQFEANGEVKSLYWQRGEPVLPVVGPSNGAGEEHIEVLRWGNRDKEAPFPQTGWARTDSLDAGKWSYLKPKPALIPVTYGVEKGKWFRIAHGIRGVVVEREGEKRVYMLTGEANPEYLAKTSHARMPLLEDQDNINWLPGDPSGMRFCPTTNSQRIMIMR